MIFLFFFIMNMMFGNTLMSVEMRLSAGVSRKKRGFLLYSSLQNPGKKRVEHSSRRLTSETEFCSSPLFFCDSSVFNIFEWKKEFFVCCVILFFHRKYTSGPRGVKRGSDVMFFFERKKGENRYSRWFIIFSLLILCLSGFCVTHKRRGGGENRRKRNNSSFRQLICVNNWFPLFSYSLLSCYILLMMM